MRTSRALMYIDTVLSMGDSLNGDDDVATGVSRPHIHNDEPNNECFHELKRFRSKNARKLIIAGLNINSLRNKFGPVNEILQKEYIDVFCISESKLDNSFPNSQFSSKGYYCFRQDSSARSGGLITWVRHDLPCRKRDEIAISDVDIQSLVVELRVRKEKWFIVSLYRLPNANVQRFCSQVSRILEKITKESDMCIIVGDINIDLLSNNSNQNAFFEILTLFNMQNIVKDPTCFKGTPSLIDVIITSNSRRMGKVLNFNCWLSDYHNLIATCTRIDMPKSKKQVITYRSYKHFNDDAFKEDIKRIPLSVPEVFDDVSDRHWAYNQLVMSVVDEHAPVKKRFVAKNCAHMNHDLRKAIFRKRVTRNRYLKNKRNSMLWEEYRKARNEYVKINRQSMINYFKKQCASGAQSKPFWDAIKPYFSDKNNARSSIMLREGDEIVSDSQSVANVFNEYFETIVRQSGIGDDIDEMTINEITAKYENHDSIQTLRGSALLANNFRFNHVTVQYTSKMLRQVDTKKSTGYDQLPAKLVSKASECMAPMVTKLINNMIDQCTFPDTMKSAEISPIFKKDDALDKTKYRPVSVLTCVSKIFEKVINQQLSEHFYSCYARDLSAYRKNYNTQSVLLKAVDDWKWAVDQGKFVGALLMDLSKAFDVIPHGLLLAKMKAYGYSDDVIKLIRSYLTDRKQRVKVNDSRSKWVGSCMGVPQGSVLGPTLFNLFLNDLFLFMNGVEIYNYADDNTLSYVSHTMADLVENLERSGSMMTQWFLNNGMKANPDKYQTIIFCKDADVTTSLHVSGARIQSDGQVKLLGVIIDQKLSFRQHATAVCGKACRQVNALMRLSNVLDQEAKRQAYFSFIYSNFTYCPAVWLLCCKSSLDKMEKANCRALRFLYSDFDSTYDELLQKGNHKSVLVLLMHSMAIEVYKCIKGISPYFMSSLFTQQDHRYHMRNENALTLPSFSTIKYGYNSFRYLGAKIWNHLPNGIKDSSTLSIFKKRLSGFNDVSCFVRIR